MFKSQNVQNVQIGLLEPNSTPGIFTPGKVEFLYPGYIHPREGLVFLPWVIILANLASFFTLTLLKRILASLPYMPYLVTLFLLLLALARLLSSIGHPRQYVVHALCTGLSLWCMLSALAYPAQGTLKSCKPRHDLITEL